VPEFILRAVERQRDSTPYLATPLQLETPQTAARKLEGVLRTIAQAAEGTRNQVTYWGSCRLAEMVSVGLITRDRAIGLAIEAASRNGLSRHEAMRTVRSALR
jgi:hypothetical protein